MTRYPFHSTHAFLLPTRFRMSNCWRGGADDGGHDVVSGPVNVPIDVLASAFVAGDSLGLKAALFCLAGHAGCT